MSVDVYGLPMWVNVADAIAARGSPVLKSMSGMVAASDVAVSEPLSELPEMSTSGFDSPASAKNPKAPFVAKNDAIVSTHCQKQSIVTPWSLETNACGFVWKTSTSVTIPEQTTSLMASPGRSRVAEP